MPGQLRAALGALKARVRTPVLSRLRSLEWYRRLSGVPRNEIVSSRGYVFEREGRLDALVEIDPVERVALAPPDAVPGDDAAALFGALAGFDAPATFVASLENSRLYGRGVAVIGADGRVLREVSPHIGGRTEDHAIMGRTWLPRPAWLPGTTAVLSAPAGNTYYHWLFDVLPRIDLLRRAGRDLAAIERFAVNSARKPFQRETLERLGISRDRIVETDDARHLLLERAILPSLTGVSGFPPSRVCRFLKESLLPEDAAGVGATQRLYVSRKRTSRRRVRNEEALEGVLASAGFRTVHPETLPVVEQARLFARAAIVVGPHGSGLANLVFCPPGSAVVELFPPAEIKSHYFVLARQCGLRYHALAGARADLAWASDEFTVDPRALERLMAQLVR